MYYIKSVQHKDEFLSITKDKKFDFVTGQFGCAVEMIPGFYEYRVYDSDLVFQIGATETDKTKFFTLNKLLKKFFKSEGSVIERLMREHEKYNEDKEFWEGQKDLLDPYEYTDEVFAFYRGELGWDENYIDLHNEGRIFDWLQFLFNDIDYTSYVNVIPYIIVADACILLLSYITNVLYASYVLDAYFKGKSFDDIFLIPEYLTDINKFKSSWRKSKILFKEHELL